MLRFLKYLIQLILSPGHGWEDVERARPDADVLARKGLYPLIGLTALTEFLAFAYERHVTLGVILIRAIADFGAYFIALFICRLILELYLGKMCGVKPESARINTFTVLGLGLMVLVQLVTNCLPWHLVLLKFLPLYVVLILYKAAAYLEVDKTKVLSFTMLAALAVVAVPLALYYFLYLFVQ